jgi:hypothetical protein
MTEPVWGTLQEEITEVVSRTPKDVPDVVTQLEDLHDLLNKATPDDANNPVADFNHLYWTITSTVLDHLNAGAFRDPEFLTLLDVEFAKRYFDALRRWGQAATDTPHSWRVLFRHLYDRDIQSLPAAVAGVNAHVNYDLPFALIATWTKLKSGPSVVIQHQDYLHINEIFFEKIPQLRRGYLSYWQLVIDRLNGPLDDFIQDRAVEIARNHAWSDAERLWKMRDDPKAMRRANDTLDHYTAILGWVLMSPLGGYLQ